MMKKRPILYKLLFLTCAIILVAPELGYSRTKYYVVGGGRIVSSVDSSFEFNPNDSNSSDNKTYFNQESDIPNVSIDEYFLMFGVGKQPWKKD